MRHDMVQTEVYISAVRYLSWFQKWGITTHMSFHEGPKKSQIIVENHDDQGSDNILIRFLYDFRSLLLIVVTILIAFPIWDVSPTIA